MLRDLVFFTLNDFSKDDGGTVRMYGILNAIAKTGKNVILLSNATNYSNFHNSIKHVNLEKRINKFEKKYLQFLLGILPYFMVRILAFFMIQKIRNKILYYNLVGRDIVFFEYLDNSMAYVLKQVGVIDNYINDIHGIASIEFSNKTDLKFIESLINKFKYKVATLLDEKVFKNAKGYIFVSEAMKSFFENEYCFIKEKDIYIIRDGVSRNIIEQKVDYVLKSYLIEKLNITVNTKVIFFAGDFKDLGGVVDLVNSFLILLKKNKFDDIKLLLVGDGEKYSLVKEIIDKNSVQDKILLLGRIAYQNLRTYQDIATIIVCPDKMHPYSNMVPHIKYFDSLVSNKVVINGSFQSVLELNINERFSLNFEPSNIRSLLNVIEYAFSNYDDLIKKYQNNSNIVIESFNYDRTVLDAII